MGEGGRSRRLRHGKTLAPPLRKEGPAWRDPRPFSWFTPLEDIVFPAALEGCFPSAARWGACVVVLSVEAARYHWAIFDYLSTCFPNPGAYIYSINILLDSLASGSFSFLLCSGYLFSQLFFSELTGEACLILTDEVGVQRKNTVKHLQGGFFQWT